MKQWKMLFSLIVALLIVTSCGKENEARDLVSDPYSRTGFMMGTVVNVKIYNEGKEEVLTAVFDRMEELAGKITVDEPGSEVEAINQQAGIAPVAVSEDVYELLEAAYAYSEETRGSFDMTIGPLTELWHIGFDDARKPEQTEIDEALTLVDYRQVEFDEANQTVYLPKQGMRLDLGAIAKGYITDEVVKVLKEHEVDTAIVDLGGNVFVLGHSPRAENADWNVGVQDPFETRGEILGSIPVSNQTIVTSGIYERFLEVDGMQYHHLMDPETGYPFDNEIAGVSIISEKSIDGDGLSTAAFSDGLEAGLDYIEQIEGVEAIFVTKDRNVYVTDGLKKGFHLNNDTFTLQE
ncbi:FAD:protein FMN transferase [Carnobacterium sp. CS13]|uniref:FAD:protein FMN transferase n=1 Tax=Carnobacterium sp. CS13 TaxID=2800128 RepID=UPI001911C16F|nr:FAD:protein FMN transferase [Carnobacterium sp. CS13]QQP70246.1 FAD:protein FMN transferase [Carnobacterium sp. CS13]